VTLLSVVGDDAEGAALGQALRAHHVDVDRLLVVPGRRTLVKQRLWAGAQLLARFDAGDTTGIGRPAGDALVATLAELFDRHDAVVVSDYGHGLIGPAVLASLRELQSSAPRVLMVDAKRPTAYRRLGVTAVKPNYDEVVQLLGIGRFEEVGRRADQIARQGQRILELTGAELAAVTLDADGALVFEADTPAYRTYARPGPDGRATGAGDTFTSAFALALAAGAQGPAAAELASAAAAVVLGQQGTAVCSARSLREAVSVGARKVVTVDQVAARVAMHRAAGRRIVFTNGCFDILHRGHIAYLNAAKALGDVLVVGVNADAGVRRLKGPDRPLNTLEDRLEVLAALSCIDHLIHFDEDTPCELIRALKPDVFVKGGDYTRERLPEAPLVEALGGVVQILPYLQDRSTTGIIQKIQATNGHGADSKVGAGK
jgi:D-beta-D-heptose 7-phosphate kinase/D-beta-D-heptose 1-phosphate adenosyltransferase